MERKISMYLAGSIKKGHEKTDDTYWTDVEMNFLKESLNPYQVSFLNPAFRTDNLTDQYSVFGRDMLQIFCSDFVLVDARDRRGLGVGAEMMWAKVNQIPVITWSPRDTHYNQSSTTILGVEVNNFVHPFVAALSDCIALSLQEAVSWIKEKFVHEGTKIKGLEVMHNAMRHYQEVGFNHDSPMKELIEQCQVLQARSLTLKR